MTDSEGKLGIPNSIKPEELRKLANGIRALVAVDTSKANLSPTSPSAKFDRAIGQESHLPDMNSVNKDIGRYRKRDAG